VIKTPLAREDPRRRRRRSRRSPWRARPSASRAHEDRGRASRIEAIAEASAGFVIESLQSFQNVFRSGLKRASYERADAWSPTAWAPTCPPRIDGHAWPVLRSGARDACSDGGLFRRQPATAVDLRARIMGVHLGVDHTCSSDGRHSRARAVAKEGEAGRNEDHAVPRYGHDRAVAGAVAGIAYGLESMRARRGIRSATPWDSGCSRWSADAGTALIMWMASRFREGHRQRDLTDASSLGSSWRLPQPSPASYTPISTGELKLFVVIGSWW